MTPKELDDERKALRLQSEKDREADQKKYSFFAKSREKKKSAALNIDKGKNAAPATEKAQVRCVRLTPTAHVPVRSSTGAAGLDLMADVDCTIQPGEQKKISTGIAIQMPEGIYGQIAPRSGLAAKYQIDVHGGVIDRDYRGDISVLLYNAGQEEMVVSKGDRIAQLLLQCISEANCDVVEKLEDTDRGTKGFGSTGVAAASAVHSRTRTKTPRMPIRSNAFRSMPKHDVVPFYSAVSYTHLTLPTKRIV